MWFQVILIQHRFHPGSRPYACPQAGSNTYNLSYVQMQMDFRHLMGLKDNYTSFPRSLIFTIPKYAIKWPSLRHGTNTISTVFFAIPNYKNDCMSEQRCLAIRL